MNIIFRLSFQRHFFVSFLMMASFLTLVMVNPASGMNAVIASKSRVADSMSVNEQGHDYQGEIVFIEHEINKIKADLTWLSERINKMEAFKQFVPQKMLDSVEYKKSKIQILTKLKNRYEKMIENETVNQVKKDQIRVMPVADGCSFDQLEKKVQQHGLADWLEVVKTPKNLKIENTLPILFASGSAVIAPEYQSFLKDLSAVLKGCNVRIFIDGYADIDPINTKKYPSNFELGAMRAANVAHALIRNGLNPSSFKIGSTGQYRFANHKASEWKSLERHVNLLVEVR